MSVYDKLQNKLLDKFIEKYGVKIDNKKFLNSISEISIANFYVLAQSGLKDDTPIKPEYVSAKQPTLDKIKSDFSTIYKEMLTDVIKQRLAIELAPGIVFEHKMDKLLQDFDNMMTYIMEMESYYCDASRTFRDNVPYSQRTMGFLPKEDFEKLIEDGQPTIQSASELLLASFNRKSTSQIVSEIKSNYMRESSTYDDYICAAKAVKAQHAKRGFWSKLFHPIDNYRENKLYSDLVAKATEVAPEGAVVNTDIEDIHYIGKKYQFIYDKMKEGLESVAQAKDNPEKFNAEMTEKIKTLYAINPERASSTDDELANDIEKANPNPEQNLNVDIDELLFTSNKVAGDNNSAHKEQVEVGIIEEPQANAEPEIEQNQPEIEAPVA